MNQLVLIDLKKKRSQGGPHNFLVVKLGAQIHDIMVSVHQSQWEVVGSMKYEVFVISSKSCKITRKVKLQMKHADDQEKILSLGHTPNHFVTLSHYGEGNNSLHVSCFKETTGECTDTLDMTQHAGGYGLLLNLAVATTVKQSLFVVSLSGGSLHMIGCHKGVLHHLQKLQCSASATTQICAFEFKGQQYFAPGSWYKSYIFKLTY